MSILTGNLRARDQYINWEMDLTDMWLRFAVFEYRR